MGIVKWLHRKPIRRNIAKLRLLYLMWNHHRLNVKWLHDQTNMHLATLRLLKARIEYYRTCFEPWGKYRPECSYDIYAQRSYNREAVRLGLKKMGSND